jgi:hypothetical protein
MRRSIDLEIEEFEERHIREMREEGLLNPTLVKPDKNKPKDDAPAPVDPGELPF